MKTVPGVLHGRESSTAGGNVRRAWLKMCRLLKMLTIRACKRPSASAGLALTPRPGPVQSGLRTTDCIFLSKSARVIDVAPCLKTAKPLVFFFVFASSVCQFLARCQSPTGGFAGGPGQHAHLAPTYAAVNALCIIGTEEAYGVIDRYSLCSTSCMSVVVTGNVKV